MYLLATVALIAWIIVLLVVAYRIIERDDIGGGTKALWIVLILLFPLVGLLYLLAPQLWLSSVGLIEDPRRSVTTLLLGCAGSIVLVALHRHRWQSGVRVATHVVPPLAVLWFMTGALPAATAYCSGGL